MSIAELQKLINQPFEPVEQFDFAVQAYRIFTKQAEIVKSTLTENSKKIEEITLNRIMKADPLIPIASGRSKILSSDLLKKIAINLGIPVEEPETALNIELYKNPVPVVISTSGEREEPKKLATEFSNHGVAPIAITANLNSSIAKCAGEENTIPLKVPTEDKEIKEIKKYCPLGNLGEFSSMLTVMHIAGTLASKIHDLHDSPASYANLMIDEIYYNILKFYPHFSRRKELHSTICKKIADSDFLGLAGEEYSSNIVRSFSIRIKQLLTREKETRRIHVFNSDEANPLYSPEFSKKHEKAVIFGNSGRGIGFAKDIIEKAKILRERPEIKGKTEIDIIGMTFTPNSYIHRESDHAMILPNSYIQLSLDGSTVLRTYEPLSLIVTDSMVPAIAIYSGIEPDRINELMEKTHNILGY
ncbi:MAG: hypothetical protein QMD12_02600 [Candidatus Aenigmarchaeota archaeon]|nr:hypothetical protein [Candidatus Aenigmarchaeota archaeon]